MNRVYWMAKWFRRTAGSFLQKCALLGRPLPLCWAMPLCWAVRPVPAPGSRSARWAAAARPLAGRVPHCWARSLLDCWVGRKPARWAARVLPRLGRSRARLGWFGRWAEWVIAGLFIFLKQFLNSRIRQVCKINTKWYRSPKIMKPVLLSL